ncbi:MAG: hypothetical protein KDC71_17435 [Acidobacteria bacterium]|nr:hypothetical protein [Acidobacteriota bacterium]
MLLLCLMFGFQANSGGLLENVLTRVSAEKEPGLGFLEMGLLAGGYLDSEGLQVAQSKLHDFLAQIQPEGLESGSDKWLKKLGKNLDGKLKKSEDLEADPLSALEGQFSPVTAAFLLAAAAPETKLDQLKGLSKKADAQFFEGTRTRQDLLSAMMNLGAYQVVKTFPAQSALLLELSLKLAPNFAYVGPQLDAHFYNEALTLFNDKKIELCGLLGAAGFSRYPERKEFLPVCFNAGVSLMQVAEAENKIPETLVICEKLAPLTGEHREKFETGVAHLLCVQADHLRTSGALLEGLSFAKRAAALNPVCNLDILIWEALIRDSYGNAEDQAGYWAALRERAPDRAQNLELWMRQNQVAGAVDDGKLEEALDLVAQDISVENGVTNYLAVLHRWVLKSQKAGDYAAIFAKLDQVPAQVAEHPTLAALRLDTYQVQLKSAGKDFQKVAAIYEKLFADPQIKKSNLGLDDFRDDYGNVLVELVEAHVAKDQFQEANALCQSALKKLPNHPGLVKEAARMAQIMKRIQ